MTTPKKPAVIECPELKQELAEIDAFVNQFEDYLVGFAVIFSGHSLEEARAAGIH